VLAVFWEVCADGAALALADGFGSAANALRVNVAISKTIIGFFMRCVLVEAIMFLS